MEHRNNGRGCEPFEDQVSSDIGDVIQAPESDLMTRGVAVNLFKVTSLIGTQNESAKHKKLTREESFPGNTIVVVKRAIEPSVDGTVELSRKAPMSVSKPADLG